MTTQRPLSALDNYNIRWITLKHFYVGRKRKRDKMSAIKFNSWIRDNSTDFMLDICIKIIHKGFKARKKMGNCSEELGVALNF